jgi:hypothetical protein
MKYEAMKCKNNGQRPFLLVPVLHEKRTSRLLRSQDCLVYGYLLFLARKNLTASQTRIWESLGQDREGVKQSLNRLVSSKLVQVTGQDYAAVAPPQEHEFRLQSKIKNEWYERFVYDRVYLPSCPTRLPVRANLLFWHLVRLASPVQGMPGHLRLGGSDNEYYTHTYWANAIGCDRKTAGASIQRLKNLKLITTALYHKGYAVGIHPLKNHCDLWRESWGDEPRVAPPVTAKQLFAVPSPAAVATEDSRYYGKVIKILRQHGVAGTLADDLATKIVEEELDPDHWIPMLKKAHVDNYANYEDGKTGNPHCGFLFRLKLQEHLDLVRDNREINARNRIRTSDEMDYENLISTLHLGSREKTLLSQAIREEYLMSDDGQMVPCGLTRDKVAEMARAAKGNSRAFKKAVIRSVVDLGDDASRTFRWVRQWQQGTDEEIEDNTALEEKGVPSWDWLNCREVANFCLTGNRNLESGEVVGQINTLLMLACWQASPSPNQTIGEAIKQSIRDLHLRGDQEDQGGGNIDGSIPARTLELGKLWLAKAI